MHNQGNSWICKVRPVLGRIIKLPSWWLGLLLIILSLLSPLPSPGLAVELSLAAEGADQQGSPLRQDEIWAEAQAFVAENNTDKAALYFRHYWKNYPDSPRAADALWQAAMLYKKKELASRQPDWVKVKDLFYSYIIDFPESSRVAEAYYEVGNSYFYMGFYREAQNYYTLFLKQYPKHVLKNEALYMRGRALLHVGKYPEASEDFASLMASASKIQRLRGETGRAYVHFFKGEWHDALGIFKKIHRHNPDYYLMAPEMLRDMGVASLRVGNHEEGRDFLLHYLNIGEHAQVDDEAYFEVGESFLEEGQVDGARFFYEHVVQRADKHSKYAILSKFRLAQYGAIKLDTMSEKERLAFFKKNGDKPFQKVLDKLYHDPLAQESRYSLFQRYLERQEWELATITGKAYLRYQTKEKERAEVVDRLGGIFKGEIKQLLKEKEYGKVRSLYEKEYTTITAYPKADLLILIGEAFAAESLYDQASVVFYRALALDMAEETKTQLYFRRAEVYLANNDLKSAQRLLKYLRRIYQGKPDLAEVNWLSARLRKQQNRGEDAREFYKMAVEAGVKSPRRAIYAEDYLRQLFGLGEMTRVADLITMFHKDEWLAVPRIQFWYNRFGLVLLERGEKNEALQAFQNGLASDLPQASPEAQPIHLHLGNLLQDRGKHEQAKAHYQMARDGADKRISQLAQARLKDYEIRGTLADVKAML